MEKVCLSSGYTMPVLGLGTWRAAPDIVTKAVLTALRVGYRLIDTAYNYKNEEAIGDAIQEWIKEGNSRESLFITTKLPNFGNRRADVENYLNKSLKRLKLDYVDLYLVHMPFTLCPDDTGEAPAVNNDGTVVLDKTDHAAVWREMEKQVAAKKVRSIGLSNFNRAQIEKLCVDAVIMPTCLQIEMHAALQQKELREFCNQRNITITAFSPLGSPGVNDHLRSKYQMSIVPPDVLHNSVVSKLAETYDRTKAQILLRHLIQLGVTVIPKSTNAERISENSQIFDFQLNCEEMDQMSTLDQGLQGRIFNFLFFKGVENHSEYPFQDELESMVKPLEIINNC